MDTKSFTYTLLLGAALCVAVGGTQTQQTATGCPFDGTSCQKYCASQGCNLGYCGNFAWIQCICRKCGDEWNSYDKLRLNLSAQLNQTELDSLKLLNRAVATDPLVPPSQPQQPPAPEPTQGPTQSTDAPQPAEDESSEASGQPRPPQQENTLTLLLVPDLSSDNDNLDQNEIPDENSEKFLDYLVDNHAKLVQATLARAASQSFSSEDGAQPDEELIEIQLSSNNSSRLGVDEQSAPQTTTTSPLQNLLRPETTATDRTTSSSA